MAASFPASYDALTNPAAGSLLTSPSHATQHINANDVVEAIEQRVGLSGSSFPGSPSTGQFFHHTTRRMNYYYDGTRWLSETLYQLPLVGGQEALLPSSASLVVAYTTVPPLEGNSDIWAIAATNWFYVGGGATALGASHKWVGQIKKLPDAGTGASGTVIATFNIDSGASDSMRGQTVSIGALLNAGTVHVGFSVPYTKTGTPGTLRASQILSYRLVG